MPARAPTPRTTTTIAAIATPPGPGVRGVIRISGPATLSLLQATTTLLGPPLAPHTPRTARTGTFHDSRGHQPLLLLWMPGPRSYTREDVAELHLPGSPPLLQAALQHLLHLGATLPSPGEFTRRAFENGRIDLARAEGVLALVHASSEHERRSATALLLGGLGDRIASLRERLEDLRALAEASLDFDERDTGHVPAEQLAHMAASALAALEEARAWEERREPLSGTPRIALAGAPNAGKSSLFNRLTGGRALVSDIPGTTRDGVAGLWRLVGSDCRLLDAPGLEPGATQADRLAQELARKERQAVDLLLWLVDARRAPDSGDKTPPELEAERAELPAGTPVLLLWSQADRVPGFTPPATAGLAGLRQLALSAHTGAGLESLEPACAAALGLTTTATAALDAPAPDNLGRELSLRHRQALDSTRRDLQVALDLLQVPGTPLDLVAEALRAATDALDAIAGRTTPEDLLDRIFARFCLGK